MTHASRCSQLLIATVLAGCGASVEEQIEGLRGGGERAETARQQLLLARGAAIRPLLMALDGDDPRGRPEVAAVLFSLWTRLSDKRVLSRLEVALAGDQDAAVQSRIARLAGMHLRPELIPALFIALADADSEVRYEAAVALNGLSGRMTDEQRDRLEAHSRQMIADEHEGVRLEGEILLEQTVEELGRKAQAEALAGELAVAESLLKQAIEHYPGSKQGQYRLGRFHMDNGKEEEGLSRLRDHELLVDVPRVAVAPTVDGRLDDSAWASAMRVSSFYLFARVHKGTPACTDPTAWQAVATDDALFLGFWGYDAFPDSLIAVGVPDSSDWSAGMEPLFRDDSFECFIDANFDHTSYAHFATNANAAVADRWAARPNEKDRIWDAPVIVGAHVGEDFWSAELMVPFDDRYFPTPESGTLWGLNVMRTYRGQSKCQWVRTTESAHRPDEFGVLHFQ